MTFIPLECVPINFNIYINKMRKWLSLFVFSLSLAIIIIDSTVLNVSIRNIITDLNTDIVTIQWIIAVYSLVMSALMITGGRLGDLFGRKKMFVLGAIIFAIGSAISSFSTSANMLLFGWSIVEGVGAALMMPASSSLLISTFTEKKERGVAFGIFGGVAAAAGALGPIVGGYLTTNYSWHWAFRINLLIVLVLVVMSVIIKESRDTKEKIQIDWLGVLLSSISIFLIVFGIVQANTYGWLQAKQPLTVFNLTIDLGQLSVIPVSIVLGAIVFVLFVLWQIRREKSGKTPLLSMKLFANKQFSAGLLMTTVLALSQAGIFFSIPVFLQAVRHLNAFDTGMSLLPLSIAILFAAPLSTVLSRKLSPKYVVQIGLILDVIALYIMFNTFTINTTATDLIPSLLILGFGMGFVFAQINNFTLSAVEPYQAGEASGISQTLRQLGSALGAAVIGTIFISTLTTALTNNINDSSVIPQPVKTLMNNQVSSSAANIEFSGFNYGSSQSVPALIKNELENIVGNSIVTANKDALFAAMGFMLLSIATSFALPKSIGGYEQNDKKLKADSV